MADNKLYRQLDGELDVIYDEVVSVRSDQHIFWHMQEMIHANSTINVPSEFYQWMGRMYAASMSAAIRRQVDERNDAVSFLRFLRELKRHPDVVTRERYKSLCAGRVPEDYVNADFDRLVGVGKNMMSPGDVQVDIDELIAKADVLRSTRMQRSLIAGRRHLR